MRGVLVDVKVIARYGDDRILGATISGKYAIIDILGGGGFGTVYLAVQEPIGRQVALKLVHRRHLTNEQLRQRFFREARIVAQLTDPTVVALYDHGEDEHHGLYIVFELVRGHTLHQMIKAGPQDPTWTAHIMLQVLGALAEAHRMGMVHRDIKPGNVMVVQDAHGRQRARLLDFGIAKVLPRDNGEASLETREGLVLGTPRYMSPEQARGHGDIDARSDLYSLAVLGYALLAGKNPFERPSVIETIMAHVQAPPPPLGPELKVPPAFETVLRQALEKEPAARYPSAEEMSQAIHAAFEGVPPPRNASTWSQPRSGFGSPVSGLATPTPQPSISAIEVSAPFSEPGSASLLDVTHPSPSVRSVSLTEPSTSSRRPLVAILTLLIVVLVAAAGAWALQTSHPDELVVVDPSSVGMPPVPDQPSALERTPPPSTDTEAAPSADGTTEAESPTGPAPIEPIPSATSDRDPQPADEDRPSATVEPEPSERLGSSAETRRPPSLPTAPYARARVLARQGDDRAALKNLVAAFEALPTAKRRAALYARTAKDPVLRDLLDQPELRSFAPASPSVGGTGKKPKRPTAGKVPPTKAEEVPPPPPLKVPEF